MAAPLDWPLLQLITQSGNCVPFLTLVAYQAIGRGYPLVTLQLIHLSKKPLPLSPRSKQKQVPFYFDKFTKLCTYLRNRTFLPSLSLWRGISSAVIWPSSAWISTLVTEHLTLVVFILKKFSCLLENKAYCFTTSLGKRFEERTPMSSLFRRVPLTV